jgi:hypothetical protein
VSGPLLSAIVPTPYKFGAIRRTVRYLAAQTIADRIELVVVCTSKDTLQLDRQVVQGFWGHRVVEIPSVHSVAAGYEAGVRAATAPVVVFCEDHAFPERQWAEHLVAAHREPYAVVGPVLHSANPDTLVSRADFLISYGPWAEPIEAREPAHLPGHNSSYKRDILLGYGDQLRQMLEAESVLHWDLRRRGHGLLLCAAARLAHTNFVQPGMWLNVQYQVGRSFAARRVVGWSIGRRLFYACASPLIPGKRFVSLMTDARRIRGKHRVGPALGIVSLAGLIAGALGEAIGYLTGTPGTPAVDYEFLRVRYITDADRQQLAQSEPAARWPVTDGS